MSTRKTLAQGLRMLSGSDSGYYTLQFLDPIKKNRAGDSMPIVVDYVEIGRDSRCAVHIGEEYPTVSRRHACIERRGNDIIIRNLSSTNPTLVNGIETQNTILNNGDEIQFSRKGPRMRFFSTGGRTSSMGMTQRLQLFAQQSLRPLRYGIAALLFILLGAGVLGAVLLNQQNNKVKAAQENLASLEEKVASNEQSISDIKTTKKGGNVITRIIERIWPSSQPAIVTSQPTTPSQPEATTSSTTPNEAAGSTSEDASSNKTEIATPANPAQALPRGDIYIVEVKELKITTSEGEIKTFDFEFSGTGFMCNDGKFVTARHVVQPWRFRSIILNDPSLIFAKINNFEIEGGRLDIIFMARSSSKPPFQFTYKQLILDDSKDVIKEYEDLEVKVAPDSKTDWAYVNINSASSIEYDPVLSRKLKAGERVYMYGYTLGLDLVSKKKLDPLFSEATIAQNGITNGMINVSDKSFGGGHSGGPVFIFKDGKPIVIGIVTAEVISAKSIGIVLPIPNFDAMEN